MTMLTVVAGVEATTRSILVYSVVLVASTFLLWPVAPMGLTYVAAAAVLGAVFVVRAGQLRSRRTPRTAMSLFRYSIVYLALLFGAVAVDTLVRYGL